MLSHLKPLSGVAGFLLANGALGDTDALEIRKELIKNDKVEAIIICNYVTFLLCRLLNALKINTIRETYPQKACSKVTWLHSYISKKRYPYQG